jgi:hypothetical protein
MMAITVAIPPIASQLISKGASLGVGLVLSYVSVLSEVSLGSVLSYEPVDESLVSPEPVELVFESVVFFESVADSVVFVESELDSVDSVVFFESEAVSVEVES